MKRFPLPLVLIVSALRATLFLGAGLTIAQPSAGAPGGFEVTGTLATARQVHTATLLPNGKVLVAGGEVGSFAPSATAELYDPASGTWTETANLIHARYGHTSTLLPNGQVLVAGGADDGVFLASAELYDPATGTWTETGSLNTGRLYHTATLLPNGQVLVAGGSGIAGTLASAELYDPSIGTWTGAGSPSTPRCFHTATLLPNGKVLVAGGSDIGVVMSAELYDPVSGNWTTTSGLATARGGHTATLLPNGMVLIAGGYNDNGSLASAELYDPASGIWTTTSSLATTRGAHTATLLSNGMVLVAGGLHPTRTASAELYDPESGTWSATGSLLTPRYSHTATLLPSGMVLVAGGIDDGVYLASAELFDPSPPLIFSPLAATGTVGFPFSYQFEALVASSLAVSGLPEGLTFDPSLRAIVGNPTVEGTFQVGLSASNSFGITNVMLVLTIQSSPISGPMIISVTSATGRTGNPFHFQGSTSNAPTGLYAYELPEGLSANSMTGEITGTVTTDGSYLVKLYAADWDFLHEGTLQLTFTSDLARPVIVSPNTVFLFPGLDFNYKIEAPTSDSSDPVTYSVIGALPPGLTLDTVTGIISGTPQASFELQPTPLLPGTHVGTVQLFACNSSGCAAQGLLFLLPTGAANISTRLSVGTGDDVLIGGFITEGKAPMKLVLRGIGPALPLEGVLVDPYLELHNGASLIASNDNWKDDLAGGSQQVAIENTGLAPTNDLESAILGTLDAGVYTAILQGTSSGTGVGLVEIYNLGAASAEVSSEARLANISTRGNVQTGDNVMIGGFINQGSTPIRVLVRAIGPSLAASSVNGALVNPVLEMHKADGSVVTNDDWMTDQKTDIMATGLAPTDALESAILITLPVGEGGYTAIVHGANGTTGVGLVEAYFGDPCLGTSCP